MTTFWLIVGALLLLAVVWFVPALRRGHREHLASQQVRNIEIARERLKELEAERERGELEDAGFEQAREELKLTLASELEEEQGEAKRSGSQPVLVSILVLVSVISLLSYRLIGSPEHIAVVGPGARAPAINPHSPDSPTDVETLVQALADRLEAEPNNPDGWFLLGRTRMSLGRYEDASAAYERALKLAGEHPAILVALADSVAMTQSGRMAGRPAELVQRALAVSPDDVTALWLAGQAASEQGDARQALAYWRRAETGLQGQPELLAELRGMIAELEGGTVVEAAPAAAAGSSLELDVSVAPELAGRFEPGDTVFIFARAEQGPPMPLAAAKLRAADLPALVTLDDSMAMMPQMKLSSFERVKVGARISRSGQPVAQSGDLQSETRIVDVGAGSRLELRIDRQIP